MAVLAVFLTHLLLAVCCRVCVDVCGSAQVVNTVSKSTFQVYLFFIMKALPINLLSSSGGLIIDFELEDS